MVQKLILLGVLGMSAYQDWKKKKVSVYLVLAAGIAGLLCHLCSSQMAVTDMLLGASVGAILLLCGFFSEEKIGYGDGAIVMVCGIFLGFEANLELLCIALFFLEIVALLLIVVKRKGRRCQIPFIPFLLVGYLLLLI